MSSVPHGGFVVTTKEKGIYHDTIKWGTIKKIIELLAIEENSPKVGELEAHLHDINSVYVWTPKPTLPK
jgi:hypothetical protein